MGSSRFQFKAIAAVSAARGIVAASVGREIRLTALVKDTHGRLAGSLTFEGLRGRDVERAVVPCDCVFGKGTIRCLHLMKGCNTISFLYCNQSHSLAHSEEKCIL